MQPGRQRHVLLSMGSALTQGACLWRQQKKKHGRLQLCCLWAQIFSFVELLKLCCTSVNHWKVDEGCWSLLQHSLTIVSLEERFSEHITNATVTISEGSSTLKVFVFADVDVYVFTKTESLR